MAAGSSIEPFWKLYPQHLEARAFDLLADYRIGNIKRLLDAPECDIDGSDPYCAEPVRHPALQVRRGGDIGVFFLFFFLGGGVTPLTILTVSSPCLFSLSLALDRETLHPRTPIWSPRR